jgi:hypothetical protein
MWHPFATGFIEGFLLGVGVCCAALARWSYQQRSGLKAMNAEVARINDELLLVNAALEGLRRDTLL